MHARRSTPRHPMPLHSAIHSRALLKSITEYLRHGHSEIVEGFGYMHKKMPLIIFMPPPRLEIRKLYNKDPRAPYNGNHAVKI